MTTKFQTDPMLYHIFTKDVWDTLKDVKTLENELQNIVDAWAGFYKFPDSICTIKIKHLPDPAEQGRFEGKNNYLYLERDLVVSKLKPVNSSRERPSVNMLSNKETMCILAHEFRHAMQNYYRKHPERCPDKTYLEMLQLNTERQQHPSLRAYFCNKGEETELLYMCQFVERDAYIFANDFCLEWNAMMHQQYPDDLTFYIHDDYAKFEQRKQEANDLFQVDFCSAVDDIVRYINGREPLNPINEEIMEVVQETQTYKATRQPLPKLFEKFPFDMRPAHKQKQMPNEEYHHYTNKDERDRR